MKGFIQKDYKHDPDPTDNQHQRMILNILHQHVTGLAGI